jgi:hypothetical protein
VIRYAAFSDCSSLSSFWIPASVEKLSCICFSGCASLSEVTFEPNSRLSVIETGAFYGCSLLSPLSIPASVAPPR